MKYVKKMPATDPIVSKKLEELGWKKIKEPRSLPVAILLSIPLMLLLAAFTVWFGALLKPELLEFIKANQFSIRIPINLTTLLFIVMIFVYVYIHEMIHAIFIPNFMTSDNTFWGINGLFGFVFTQETMTKERFILVCCMPFIILTPVAMVVLNSIGFLNHYTFILCLINAAGACVDFLNIILIGFQVKSGHMIVTNGFETYYNPNK